MEQGMLTLDRWLLVMLLLRSSLQLRLAMASTELSTLKIVMPRFFVLANVDLLSQGQANA
jgi:hypothetical protein